MTTTTYRTLPVIGVLGAWLALMAALAHSGRLQPPAELILAVAVPLFSFLGFYALYEPFRDWVRGGDPKLLVLLHSWRTLGAVFLALGLFGLLPWEFALPAGLGDIAIGIAAPFVALGLWKGRVGAFYLWTALGLLDFAVAIGTGTMIRAGALGSEPQMLMSVMNEVPFVLIPGFIVPAYAIAHVAALLQVKAR